MSSMMKYFLLPVVLVNVTKAVKYPEDKTAAEETLGEIKEIKKFAEEIKEMFDSDSDDDSGADTGSDTETHTFTAISETTDTGSDTETHTFTAISETTDTGTTAISETTDTGTTAISEATVSPTHSSSTSSHSSSGTDDNHETGSESGSSTTDDDTDDGYSAFSFEEDCVENPDAVWCHQAAYEQDVGIMAYANVNSHEKLEREQDTIKLDVEEVDQSIALAIDEFFGEDGDTVVQALTKATEHKHAHRDLKFRKETGGADIDLDYSETILMMNERVHEAIRNTHVNWDNLDGERPNDDIEEHLEEALEKYYQWGLINNGHFDSIEDAIYSSEIAWVSANRFMAGNVDEFYWESIFYVDMVVDAEWVGGEWERNINAECVDLRWEGYSIWTASYLGFVYVATPQWELCEACYVDGRPDLVYTREQCRAFCPATFELEQQTIQCTSWEVVS